MKIAVASGKGGTGKTTIALALAQAAGKDSWLFDCDVEEPNAHLFLQEEPSETRKVTLPLPKALRENCTGCGKCVEVCRFHALARLGKKILVFPELCHSCGGCLLACGEKALEETAFPIGELRLTHSPHFHLASGVMDVGYSMAPFVIRELKKFADTLSAPYKIFDAPPGTSCSMVTAVRGCSHVLLVTEPTPFGLHDLILACETLKELQIPCSVILNRAGENDPLIEDFCRKNAIPLRLKIPFSREIAKGYSEGKRLLDIEEGLREKFRALLKALERGS